MPRDIPIGDGSFLIAHDQNYFLRDIYYPSIAKENRMDGHGIKFGVWVDGKLDWIDGSWKFNFEYVHESLVTNVEGVNDTLGVTVR